MKTLSDYRKALKERAAAYKQRAEETTRSKDLLELDTEISNLKSSMSDNINSTQLSKIIQYKLSRGKWRPNLQKLADSNSPERVQEVSTRAFSAAKTGPSDLTALEILCELKGVGPAAASMILSLLNPDWPFLSDEAVLEVGLGKAKYEKRFYSDFAVKMLEESKNVDWTGTLADLEEAMWCASVVERCQTKSSTKRKSGEGSTSNKKARTTL